MLAIFLGLLLLGALAVIAFSIGLVWLLFGDRGDETTSAGQPLSLSQTIVSQLEERRLWRALSAWIAAKPLRIEDRRGSGRG